MTSSDTHAEAHRTGAGMDPSYRLLESVAAESMTFGANSTSDIQALLSRLLAILQRPVIDLFQLRAFILAQGLPPPGQCAPSLRALVWKLLLGLIPPVRADWVAKLDSHRAIYDQYVFDLVHEPELITFLRYGATSPSSGRSAKGPVERVTTDDHPLAPPDSPSRWRRYWADSEIFDQVNKDVYRTRPDMDFFSESSDTLTNAVTVRGRAASLSELEDRPTSPKMHAFKVADVIAPKTHYDRICRILFLYAKLNCGYVQGMNEIVAPLYYTFYQDPAEGHFVEADAFFALTAVMQEQRDIFCATLDTSSVGMMGRLEKLTRLIEREDPAVAAHLRKIGVKVEFFALRWIMLLFAQEYDMQSVQVLWDSVFSDQTPVARISSGQCMLVHYICVAMIRKVREAILAGDFADVMKSLQRFPPFEARDVLVAAMKLRRGYVKSDSILSTNSEDVLAIIAPEMAGHHSPRRGRPSVVSVVTAPKKSFSTKVLDMVRGRRNHRHKK